MNPVSVNFLRVQRQSPSASLTQVTVELSLLKTKRSDSFRFTSFVCSAAFSCLWHFVFISKSHRLSGAVSANNLCCFHHLESRSAHLQMSPNWRRHRWAYARIKQVGFTTQSVIFVATGEVATGVRPSPFSLMYVLVGGLVYREWCQYHNGFNVWTYCIAPPIGPPPGHWKRTGTA